MNFSNRILASVALVVVVSMVAPSAVAQTVSYDPDVGQKGVATLIKPELETPTITLPFKYVFDPGQQVTGLAKTSVEAKLNLNCVDKVNILISGPQSVQVPIDVQSGAGAATIPFKFEFKIGVTRDLPGLKQITCNYSVDVTAPSQAGTAPITEGAKGSFPVSASYYGLVQAKVAQQIKQGGPQKDIPFEIAVDNLGNAKTTVQFTIEDRPGSTKWDQALPDDLILFSPTNPIGKTSDTAIFTVTTPHKTGWNNEQGSYRLRMTTYASDDPSSVGPSVATNMIIRVRGVYVPGLEPVVLVGAVLGAAMVARMRREDEE